MPVSDYSGLGAADDNGLAVHLLRLVRALDVHLLLTTVTVLLAGLLFSYVIQTTQDGLVRKELRVMTAPLAAVTSELRQAIVRLDAPASKPDDSPVDRAEALSRAARAAEVAGVKLAEVAAPDASADLLRLKLLGTYTALLGFVAESEAAGARIEDLKLERAADNDEATLLSTVLGFRAGVDRSRADPALLDQIMRLPRADPFRPVSDLSAQPSFAGAVDLAAEYQLTAITTIGAASFATIGGRDYRAGDHIGRYVILSVGPLLLELRDERHPGQRYILALPGYSPASSGKIAPLNAY